MAKTSNDFDFDSIPGNILTNIVFNLIQVTDLLNHVTLLGIFGYVWRKYLIARTSNGLFPCRLLQLHPMTV